MCGRYNLTAPPDVLAQAFFVPVPPLLVPRTRYDVAPTQSVLIVRQATDCSAVLAR